MASELQEVLDELGSVVRGGGEQTEDGCQKIKALADRFNAHFGGVFSKKPVELTKK